MIVTRENHGKRYRVPSPSRRTCAGVAPVTSTTLSREVCPDTSATARDRRPNDSARKATRASFAAPSTGGAARRTLRAPSVTPVTAVAEARGTTRTEKRTTPCARSLTTRVTGSTYRTRPSTRLSTSDKPKKATIGEMSTMPRGGMTRRKGPRMGSESTNAHRTHLE